MRKQKDYITEKTLLIIGGVTLVFGLLYVGGANTYNEDPTAYGVPGNLLDAFWAVPLFIALPLFLIKIAFERIGFTNLKLKASWIWIATFICLASANFGLFNNANNYFVKTNETIEKQYAVIDIAYQKRFNLIPNITKTAREYGKLEQGVINDIADARKAYVNSENTDQKVAAANQLDKTLNGFVIYSENYPDLKSNELYTQITEQLIQNEQEITDAKKQYNEEVSQYNKYVNSFPTIIVARITGLKEKNYLKSNLGNEMYESKELLN